MTDLTAVQDTLTRLGFEDHPQHPAGHKDRVKALSHNGKYEVLGSWQKGNVQVHVEQNTAPETVTDAQGNRFTNDAFVFPPVLVVEVLDDNGNEHVPPHRVSVSFHDLEAMERILNGDRDFEVKQG